MRRRLLSQPGAMAPVALLLVMALVPFLAPAQGAPYYGK